jgi:acetyltransferase-like isoleucine patch superfamily enzyme
MRYKRNFLAYDLTSKLSYYVCIECPGKAKTKLGEAVHVTVGLTSTVASGVRIPAFGLIHPPSLHSPHQQISTSPAW